MSVPTVVSEALGGSAIVQAMGERRTPLGWYPPAPRSRDEWSARSNAVAASAPQRWLERIAPALAATGAAADRLARVVAAGGVVVTTGQQPGLFGGPLYAWSKALSALSLADAIERCTGVGVAPIFWAATDDADFAEGSWTAIAAGADVERLALPPPPRDDAGRPLAELPLGDVTALLSRLATAAGPAVDDRVLQMVRASYGEGRTIGGAYLALLRSLLEPLGMAVLDASHPSIRAAARPLLDEAVSAAPAIELALDARAAEMRRAGFRPQVATVRGLSLVFAHVGGIRRRLPIARLAHRLDDAPLTPNVLLRPIVEQGLLPTVAYVGGPGELAYFAQVSAVAAALGAPAPLAVPRWSGTIVEPRVARILARRGLAPGELADADAAAGRLARAALPPSLAAALRDARSSALASFDALASVGGSLLDPRSLERARAAAAYQFMRLERRVVARVKRENEALVRDLSTARASLYPWGKRQERVLGFIPFLARYGDRLRDDVLAATRTHAETALGAAMDAPPGARSEVSPASIP